MSLITLILKKVPLNFLIIGVPISYLSLNSSTLKDALPNLIGGAFPITFGGSVLSDVKFPFVGEVGNMVDSLSADADNTVVMSSYNVLTAIFIGVLCVLVNGLVDCGVNSYFKFSNATLKQVASVDNGILHVAGKKPNYVTFLFRVCCLHKNTIVVVFVHTWPNISTALSMICIWKCLLSHCFKDNYLGTEYGKWS